MRLTKCQESGIPRESIPFNPTRSQATRTTPWKVFLLLPDIGALQPLPYSCRFRPCSVWPCLPYTSPSCCHCRGAARMEVLAVTDRRIRSFCPGGLGSRVRMNGSIPSTSCRIGTLLACRTLDDHLRHMTVFQVGGKWKYAFLMGQSDFLLIVETLDFLGGGLVNRSEDWKDSAEPTCQSCRIWLPWSVSLTFRIHLLFRGSL